MPDVTLRPIADADLDALFEQGRDPEAVRMAAFTVADPDDRAAFDARTARARSAPDATARAVVCDGRVVGSVATFVMDGETEITYWIDRAAWGRGIATRAVALMLELVADRPLVGRAASDNHASLRILRRAGFAVVGTATDHANARGEVIEETILRLDQPPR